MAMEMAGVNSATKNPDGGTIIKDENGNPIGVFEENAELLVTKAYNDYLNKRNDEQKLADYYEQVKLASEDCLKKGITSFHDAGETFEVIDILKKLADEEKLPIRLNVMIGETLENIETKVADYKLIGYANNFLNVRSIKQYIDGALGSRGAWLLKPYSDLPNHTGSNVTPVETLTRISEIGAINGFQMRIHAIGDRANREVLDIYEKLFDQNRDKNDFRWCIEHAQHISKEDISRFAKLGVIAAMQAIHCTSDASFVDERLGDKRAEEGAYVWKKLLESGAVICNGTDAPVEDVDPIKCFYSSVTRKSKDGTTFYPEQIMTRMEALKSYTTNGAYASFEEKIKGKIEPGMLADLTVLSNDIINCSDDEILGTKVLYTIIDGKIKYQSN
jgi:predicted amidohydrolase YtcJ